MIQKRPINSQRLRSLPPSGFGWIDHRLLREGYFQRCSPAALALYSLLVCAGDAQGLSFYSEPRVSELLGLEPGELPRARNELIAAQLIAFEKPLYQVLALDREDRPPRTCSSSRAVGGRTAKSSSLVPTPPPSPARMEVASAPPLPASAGLSLRAMVEASLKKGGAQ
jgi:hypothetical protein